MNREQRLWAILVIAMLIAGLLIGRAMEPDVPREPSAGNGEAAAFRAWFWERRTFDLLAQVGLIFAGALGVAAILPTSTDLLQGDHPENEP
jgi:hypothetical protein